MTQINLRDDALTRGLAYLRPVPERSPVVQLAAVPRRPPRVDVAIAAALFAWAALEAVFATGPGSTGVRLALAAAFTVPLAWRRRWPLPVLLVVVLTLGARSAWGDVPEEGATPMPELLLAAFSVALYARPAAAAIAGLPIVLAAIIATVVLDGFADSPGAVDVAIISFICAGAWTGGWLVRLRAAQLQAAEELGPELAREAVVQERARLARELHDVVAHSVSIISVQTGAAQELLRRDPDRAEEHLEKVRRAAHDALDELRRLVGVLREDEPVYDPQPGLARLDELVDEARAAGQDVTVDADGEVRAVPPGLDLAAYRVVQEGLTNARRHAHGAPAHVAVRYGDRALEVEVVNGPDGAPNGDRGAGHGLIGMRERVRLYGGTLQTAPTEDGGFAIRATLPLEADR